MTDDSYLKTDLLSIDAWRDPDGWQWNNWRLLEAGIFWDADLPLTARRILRALRDWGYLSPASRGRLAVEDDGYNYVVMARGTREPILALAYGEYID